MLTRSQVEQLRKAPRSGVNKVALAMEMAKVTQEQVAEATGYTQPHVSRIAAGRYEDLPIETARTFAEYFGCQIDVLFPARKEAVA